MTTKRTKKARLDQLLVARGLAESRDQAARLIMAGLVYVDGQKSDKAGVSFREDVAIELRERLKYVSRGGLKLESAVQHFKLNTAGVVALDIGASTGGFTDLLLQGGAKRVYAVDVGHGQLDYRLQHDPRVINLEKTHARLLNDTLIPEPVDALVMDTSFISLAKVLPHGWPLLRPGGWCVALIKPQFEVDAALLDRGVVRDEAVRQMAIDRVVTMATALDGARLVGVIESPIHGPKGNVEYLMTLNRMGDHEP